ncbi:type IX secretion system membrane protein PorP/SprF [bacterium]|nr:type IX secretion system membrane protein PorP/SprF [bacterium]
MKNTLLYIIFILRLVTTGFAQQQGVYSQPVMAQYAYNPAFTGLERGGMLNLAYRQQWLGIKDAPVQEFLSFGFRLKKTQIDTVFPCGLPLSNNRMYKPTAQVRRTQKITHSAFGINIMTDDAGVFNKWTTQLNYAYHLLVGEKYNLSLGAALGLSYLQINRSNLWVLQPGDAVYNEYQQQNVAAQFMDANFGAVFYSRQFYIGFSSSQLLQNAPFDKMLTASAFKLRMHETFNASYIFNLGNQLELAPVLNIFGVGGAPVTSSIGIKMRWQKIFWVAVNYRPGAAANFRAGCRLLHKFLINYTYEATTGGLSTYQNGTHEIGLSLYFNNSKAIKHLW